MGEELHPKLTSAYRFKNLGPGLYPAIGLKTFRETVAVNFTGPFKYDIDTHVREVRDRIWSEAMSTTVKRIPRVVDQLTPPPPDTPRPDAEEPKTTLEDPADKTLAAMVLDHLSHSGYTSTLRATEHEMNRRGWIHRKILPFMPTSTPEIEDDPAPRSFASHTKAIDWLQSRLTTCGDLGLPWRLINELYIDMPAELEARLRIYDLQILFQNTWSKHDDSELEAIAQGRDLLQRCKAEAWPADTEASLRSTFTMLAGRHREDRSSAPLIEELIDGIRSERGARVFLTCRIARY